MTEQAPSPMLDFTLRVFTRRNILLAVLAALGVERGLPRLEHKISPLYHRWRYPPAAVAGAEGKDIVAEDEKRQYRHVLAVYQRVSGLLDQSAAEGFEVQGLRAKAAASLKYAEYGHRRDALRILSEVEMIIPRKKVQYIPMYPTEASPDSDEGQVAPAKPAPQRQAQSRKPRRRRRR